MDKIIEAYEALIDALIAQADVELIARRLRDIDICGIQFMIQNHDDPELVEEHYFMQFAMTKFLEQTWPETFWAADTITRVQLH